MMPMKTLIRLATAFCHMVVWAFIGVLIAVLFSCCSRVNYYPAETLKTDSIYIKLFERDSIYFRDSIYVQTKADTVFLNRVQYKYREIIIRDTMRIVECDTTTIIREVPREFTKLQTLKMNIGTGVLCAIPIILFLFIIYCKLKR